MESSIILICHELIHSTKIACYIDAEILFSMTKCIYNIGINCFRFETLDNVALSRKFPQFTVPPKLGAVFEPDGGIVDAAMANSVHIQLARAHGATVIDHCPVTRVTTLQNGDLQVQI